MAQKKQRILVVDDEEFNLKLLVGDLENNGYEAVKAQDGKIAIDILKNDHNFDVILLDRMMPNMDGMKALAKIKADDNLKDIPVIMQTAAASSKETQEGIDAGVYYYLTKPFEINVLLALVKSAIRDSKKTRLAINKANAVYQTYSLIEMGKFKFKTLEDVSSLAYLVSNFCYNPDEALFGIKELMMNAVEHGNLGIKFEEKTQMMIADCWIEEIEKRLKHKEFKDKQAHLSFERKKDMIEIIIEDMGKGFDPEPFMAISRARATLPNGRGIAISKMTSFHSIEYIGKGNKVVCKIAPDSKNKKDTK